MDLLTNLLLEEATEKVEEKPLKVKKAKEVGNLEKKPQKNDSESEQV